MKIDQFHQFELKLQNVSETFIPKNIEKRQVDFDRKQAEKPAKFQEFVKEFRTNLQSLQGLQVADDREQHFIDLMQGLVVVLDPQKFPDKPYVIFLYYPDSNGSSKLNNFYSFYYNWDEPEFYCMRSSHDVRFEESKYWSSHSFQIFLEDMVKMFFGLECWANVSGVHVRSSKD